MFHSVQNQDMLASRNSPIMITDDLIKALSTAISSGDQGRAKEVAERLAKENATVQMSQGSPSNLPKSDQEFKVKVCIEDKISTGNYVEMLVHASMTIADLKKKMLEKFSFPPEVQRWIVGRRLPSDNERLQKLGVRSSNAVLYLYLVTAENVKLTKKSFIDRYGYLFRDMHLPLRSTADGDASLTHPHVETYEARIPSNDVNVKRNSRSPSGSIESTALTGASSDPTIEVEGWSCSRCTLINLPTRPGCDACGCPRPENYEIPKGYVLPPSEEERLIREAEQDHLIEQERLREQRENDQQRTENFKSHLLTDSNDIFPNVEKFTCPICFSEIHANEGILLRNCLHAFCRDCLASHIEFGTEPDALCPYMDDDYQCQEPIQEREIKGVTSPHIFQKYLLRSLIRAEKQAKNSFHCKTLNCIGWCIYDDSSNFFQCQVCQQTNCLTCKVIHNGKTCKQYQEDLKINAQNNVNDEVTQKAIQAMLLKNEAMYCPLCNIVLQKKDGCDWICCSMCRTEICWVTKGPRWGPKGEGDISGGCRCRVNDKLCHPKCGNCH